MGWDFWIIILGVLNYRVMLFLYIYNDFCEFESEYRLYFDYLLFFSYVYCFVLVQFLFLMKCNFIK